MLNCVFCSLSGAFINRFSSDFVSFISGRRQWLGIYGMLRKFKDIQRDTKCLRGCQLLKSNTCIIFTCIKKNDNFSKGDWIFLKHSCMSHSNIEYRLFYAQKLSSRGLSSTLISIGQVTSWFDSVVICLACWTSFTKSYHHKHDLQKPDYNL